MFKWIKRKYQNYKMWKLLKKMDFSKIDFVYVSTHISEELALKQSLAIPKGLLGLINSKKIVVTSELKRNEMMFVDSSKINFLPCVPEIVKYNKYVEKLQQIWGA